MSQHKDSEPPRCSKTLVKRGRSRQCAVACVTTYGFLGTLHRERECITHAGSSLSQSTNNCSFLFTSHWPDLNTRYHLTARKARQSQWVDGLFGECSFPGGASGKESACQCKRCKRLGSDPWVRKIPWRRAWQPTPIFLPGESHGQRRLVGYSPWSRKELDMTQCTHTGICLPIPSV